MLCLSYYAYVFSSTKLVIRAEQVLLGSKGWWREKVEQGEEMTQTMYTHVNIQIIFFKKRSPWDLLSLFFLKISKYLLILVIQCNVIKYVCYIQR
jgi:hypothetical protein